MVKLSCEQSEYFSKYRWGAVKTTSFPGPSLAWSDVTKQSLGSISFIKVRGHFGNVVVNHWLSSYF